MSLEKSTWAAFEFSENEIILLSVARISDLSQACQLAYIYAFFGKLAYFQTQKHEDFSTSILAYF